MAHQTRRQHAGTIITIVLIVVTALSGFSLSAHAHREPSANTAGSAPVGMTASVWGSFDVSESIEVWTEVQLSGGRWVRSQDGTTNVRGGYVIPLTYGSRSVGDYQFRVAGQLPDGTISRTATFTFTRRGGVTASTAGTTSIGQRANVWGTVSGGANVSVWTEVWRSSGWLTSQKGTTNDSGGYVLPLTYGMNSAGTQTFRVAARLSDGAIIRSPEFTLTRRSSDADIDCAVDPCVALTFDDGPGKHTARLLDILKKHDVKATFFTIGWRTAARPSVVKRARDEGHQIGNHSYNHPNLTKRSASEIATELRRTSDAIHRATGERPTAMRPPYGAWNTAVRTANSDRGEGPMVLWDADTLDWKHRDPEQTVQRTKDLSRKGSIVLMHDIHSTTVDAVPDVIKALRGKGFHLVTVEHLLESDTTTSWSIRTHGPR